MQLGDQFIIIQASGTISGTFAGPGYVFLGNGEEVHRHGHRLTNQVILTHGAGGRRGQPWPLNPNDGSTNPSVYGQNITYVVTVTPADVGGPAIPTGDTVTFTFDGVTYSPVPLNANGQAVFNPQAAAVGAR